MKETFAPSSLVQDPAWACRETLGNQNKQEKQRGNNKHMSTLVVVGYDDPYKAEEVRLKLRKLQSEYLLDLEDAVVAVKDEKGKVKLHQAVNLTAAGAVSGGFWGSLEELKGTGGRVLKTSLSHEDEAKLQAALSSARS
jgi:uncharacterized membrane protein